MESVSKTPLAKIHTYEYSHPSGYKGKVIYNDEDRYKGYSSWVDPKHKLTSPLFGVNHSSMEKAHKRMTGLGYKRTGESKIKVIEDFQKIGIDYPLNIISEDPN